jgi:plastocyanin
VTVTAPRIRALVAGFIVVLCCAPAAAQGSGTIRGRVEVASHPVAVQRIPALSDASSPARPPDHDPTRSVVYLESAPMGAFDRPDPGRATVDQRNETFVPHVLAVTIGTRVEFPNHDGIYHNVFSLSKAARFDLGRYAAGKSKSVVLDRPGIVRVFCEIHSHMNAFILVFSHPFFALTDEQGRYHLDNVPPGRYNLIAWNEGVTLPPRQVTVTTSGIAEADFSFR